MKKNQQPKRIDDQLRQAIADSGVNLNQIAMGAGVPHAMLYRFNVQGKDLRLSTAVKLAAYFGMELTEPNLPASLMVAANTSSGTEPLATSRTPRQAPNPARRRTVRKKFS
jgi:predicted transcriptional regulator